MGTIPTGYGVRFLYDNRSSFSSLHGSLVRKQFENSTNLRRNRIHMDSDDVRNQHSSSNSDGYNLCDHRNNSMDVYPSDQRDPAHDQRYSSNQQN